jgi:Transposase
MPKKSYTPEQIVGKLPQIEVLVDQGKTVPLACKESGITDQTYYQWRRECGGLQLCDAIAARAGSVASLHFETMLELSRTTKVAAHACDSPSGEDKSSVGVLEGSRSRLGSLGLNSREVASQDCGHHTPSRSRSTTASVPFTV